MTFAHPMMLWGLLGALIPLLVHLFDRRRPRPHAFSAMSFVLRSQKRTASRLKLKRILLYILRTLILLALPLALARPEWKQDAPVGVSTRGPSATVIVLDTSFSMRFREGESLFEKAQDLAREALSELLAEEPASVLLCGPNVVPPASLSFNKAHVRSSIDEATVTFGASNLNRCLDLAATALSESPLPGKRLVVVSDFAGAALRLEMPAPLVPSPSGVPVRPEVVLKDAAAGLKTLPNHALVDLKVEPALQVGPKAFQFTFTVKNESDAEVKDLEAVLKIGGQVVGKGFVDVTAHGTTQKALTHRFEAGGWVAGEIALSEDGLIEDNVRPFLVHVPKELKALVLDGAPNTVRFRDEAFFVEATLTAPGSPLRPVVRDVEAGFREDLSQYDVVMLLNAPAPSPEQAQALETFVKNGGGLFISMGDHVQPEAYNLHLSNLLPRALRLPKTSAAPEDADAALRAAKLALTRNEHPIFNVFAGDAREGLFSSRFYRYMLLEAENAPASESEVLASLEDGAPAVATRTLGKGRVLLFTSTVDRDWSDFSIRTSFLPFLQRCTAFLAGSLEEREDVRVTVGQTLTMPSKKAALMAEVTGPQKERVPLEMQGDGSAIVGPMAVPGVYQVLGKDGQVLSDEGFVTVLDASESDLTRLSPEVLTHYFGEDTVRAQAGAASARKLPLWSWLIFLAATAFIFEGVLLRKP